MKVYQFFCRDETAQECFTRKLFGNKISYDDDPPEQGDWLLLRNFDQEVQYGPFRAETDLQKDIEPDAWDGLFPWQISVSWDNLYRISDDDIPFPKTPDVNKVEGDTAEKALTILRSEGVLVSVTDNGKIEPVNEEDWEDADESAETEFSEEEPKTIIIDPIDSDDGRNLTEILKEADEPGEVLLQRPISGELRPDIYRHALSHLVSGKNLIFYGPPGSGKTRAAERLGSALCTDLHLETANAEWTHHDLVGGYRPEGIGFSPNEGFLTTTSRGCESSLIDAELPQWVLIDEINRANLDQAFGEVFTLLDVTHRNEGNLTFAGGEVSQRVPFAFRILATMNTEDQAQLFSLGYAFRRRFAFIKVPSLFHDDSLHIKSTPELSEISLEEHIERTRLVLERAVISQFDLDTEIQNDSPLGVPALSELFEAEEALDKALEAISPPDVGYDFIDAILLLAQTLDQTDVAELGQGIVIDTISYIVVHWFLFPETTDWSVIDEAVQSYFVPQLDSFMAELRKSQTVASESSAENRFQEVVNLTNDLGLARTHTRLEAALEDHQLI